METRHLDVKIERYPGRQDGYAMSGVIARVSGSGRLSIPAKFRKAIGLEQGGEVVVELDGHEIRIRMVDQVVDHAQRLTRRFLGDDPDASLDAFLAERRRESGSE
jgi:AbrB family looped-hinge helix DNA binding protein